MANRILFWQPECLLLSWYRGLFWGKCNRNLLKKICHEMSNTLCHWDIYWFLLLPWKEMHNSPHLALAIINRVVGFAEDKDQFCAMLELKVFQWVLLLMSTCFPSVEYIWKYTAKLLNLDVHSFSWWRSESPFVAFGDFQFD